MKKALMTSIGLLTASAAYSDTIHTYGAGELLETVFKMISAVLYGSSESGLDQVFKALLRICLTVGAFSAVLMAFFRQRFEPLIRNFLLPGLIIVLFLLIPRTAIEIEDHETSKKSQPIEVPFFLGKFASWTSAGFHHLQTLFKNASENGYSWIAQIDKNEHIFQRLKTDPRVERNFREVCKECVFRDLDLGLYSKKELAESPNLMEFLASRTSGLRAVEFDAKAISCKSAMEQIKKEAESLDLPTPASPSMKTGPGRLGEQKLAIDLLQEELFGHKTETGASIGAEGTGLLLSIKRFFEAALYLIFPLVILLSLLTFGIKTAFLWLRSIVWVSTWPIFYLAVDLFLNALWKCRAAPLVFNLENGPRLADLYASMELVACASLLSIPFLSWFILKTTVSQVIQIQPIPHQTERQKEPDPIQNPSPGQNIPPDLARQTNWDVLAREPQAQQDGFKATIDSSRLEERIDSLQTSLASIRESVKDSGKKISDAVKETRKEEAVAATPQAAHHSIWEDWGGNRMHLPSHGSWSDPRNSERDNR